MTKNKAKKLIILGTLVAVGAISTVIKVPLMYENTPDHLKLKSPKEDILFSRDVNISTTEYIYNSKVKVEKAEYKGIEESIEKRTQNAQFFLKETGGKEEEWHAIIYTGEPFYQNPLDDEWYKTETATTSKEEFEKQTKIGLIERLFPKAMALSTTTFTGAGDGVVDRWEEATWAIAHDSADGDDSGYTASYAYVAGVSNTTVRRGFFPANTASLPDTATITDVTFSLYGKTTSFNDDADAQNYLVVLKSYQASTAQLVIADFEDCGSDNDTGGRAKYVPVEGSDHFDLSTWDTAGYNVLTFDATGRSWIDLEGFTMICIREGHDVEDSAPSGSNLPSGFFSENSGTSEDPKLDITYTVPAPPAEEVIINNSQII